MSKDEKGEIKQDIHNVDEEKNSWNAESTVKSKRVSTMETRFQA